MEPGPAVPNQREQCLPDTASADSTGAQVEAGASPGFSDRRRHRRWWLAVLALAVAGGGIVLISTAKYGAGLSPDSLNYLDVARSLADGRGFVTHAGQPVTWWPPLYPLLLAIVGQATRLDPGGLAHVVNAMLFALVVFLAGDLLYPITRRSLAYSLLGLVAVAFARPLTDLYAMAWSECLFIPLVLAYLLLAQRYWRSPDLGPLAGLTLVTALACLTRYLGGALIAAGVVTIALAPRRHLKGRLIRAFAFGIIAAAPLGLWLMRNDRLTGTLTGNRGPSHYTFLQSLGRCLETVASWFAFSSVSSYVVLAWVAIAVTAFLLARKKRSPTEGAGTSSPELLPAGLLFCTLAIALVVAATRGASSFIDRRLAAPLYLPAAWILLSLGSRWLARGANKAARLRAGAPTLILAMWLCLSIQGVVAATAEHYRNGAGGYNARASREGQTIAYARQILPSIGSTPVFSNGPDILWEAAGIDAAELPRRDKIRLNGLKGRWPPERGSIIVLFRALTWRSYFYSIPELREVADVELLAPLNDGAFFVASPPRATSPDSAP